MALRYVSACAFIASVLAYGCVAESSGSDGDAVAHVEILRGSVLHDGVHVRAEIDVRIVAGAEPATFDWSVRVATAEPLCGAYAGFVFSSVDAAPLTLEPWEAREFRLRSQAGGIAACVSSNELSMKPTVGNHGANLFERCGEPIVLMVDGDDGRRASRGTFETTLGCSVALRFR